MVKLIKKDDQWFTTEGAQLTHVPKTRKSEHLLDSNGEVVAKRCGGLCKEMKSLEEFRKCKKGFAQKRSYCTNCEDLRVASNLRGTDIYGNPKRSIKPKAPREYDASGKCIRKQCPSCDTWKDAADYYPLASSSDGLGTNCRTCCTAIMYDAVAKDPERYKTYGHNRRAKEAALPGDLTGEQWESALDHFGHACALTGATEDLHLEHAVPVAIGHGGTVVWNAYPLVGSLNCSKSASHLFEWAAGRTDIDKPKFNRLISYLADQCGLTVDEYRSFYDFCFRNPRLTVEEIEADGDMTSLELWTNKSKEGKECA